MLWLLRGRAYFLISLLALLVGGNVLRAHLGTNVKNFDSLTLERDAAQVNKDPDDLRVMTYNVRLFRGVGKGDIEPSVKNEAIELIKSVAPDVICVQEYYTREKGVHDANRVFATDLGLEHQYVYKAVKNNFDSYGMAVFSNYPIVDSGRITEFEQGVNSIIFIDINKDGRIFRIYNVHLRSFGFQEEDYDFIKRRVNSFETGVSGTRRIGRRMKTAFEQRSQQARSLREHWKSVNHPLIIMGDFNDTPLSFAVRHVGRGLINAFTEGGRGWGVTYNGEFPNFQIDYIFASPEFEVRKFQIIKRKLSDHYPVWADLSFK